MIKARYYLTLPTFTLDVDLSFPSEGITAIWGRSGSGKTTLLRCIAGLEKVSAAELTVNGSVWQNEEKILPAHKRPVGFVFQDASLFSHLTVQKNLDYAIKRSKISQTDANKFINILGITTLLNKTPEQLSGGEKQRAAIARALLIQPALLLMDEPLASLDLQSRQEILPYLALLRKKLKLPMIYVSHALDEVFRLADYVIILQDGQVQTQGEITEVFSRLDSPINLGNETGVVIKANVCSHDHNDCLTRVDIGGEKLWIPFMSAVIGEGVRLRVLARDVSLSLTPAKDSSILNILQGQVEELSENSRVVMVGLKVGEIRVTACISQRSTRQLALQVGTSVWVQIKSIAVIR